MDSLPIELLDIIAAHGPEIYYGLLGYKFFADTLNYSKRLDFMILFGYSVTITKYDTRWLRNGFLHRVDGPAYENHNDYKSWHYNGQLHRTGGHAVQWCTGIKEWYRHGSRYRENGLPPIEDANGAPVRFVNGCYYTSSKV